ncbi:two-component system, OmpR family, response regulator [Salinihabitans flavidus]|uniref:Two-component system, OmpR family, response regulator n=2 Tax=Salinihabitans flavidus TaxID=569882 RepID=A0A1H8TM89_9RHOB|nr:two-component system, OmpR family, response regulator [Salinihabitans flavidus]
MAEEHRTRRILVLEDDPKVGALIVEGLREDGYEVVATENCNEAKREFASAAFDLLIIDVLVPDGNGMELALDIRRESDVGIIIITGHGDETDRIIGLELGADDYILKPFRVRELRARVRALLRRMTVAMPNQDEVIREELEFHGFLLDPRRRRVIDPAGQTVSLTTLEFDLLNVLVENRNMVMTRDEISRSMRGERSPIDHRSIDGLISRIRRKLFENGQGLEVIKTIHGRGYILSD